MADTKPIARIRLPTHHPIVAGSKPGDMIRLHALHVADEAEPVMSTPVKGAKPPPLESSFHVMEIRRHGGQRPTEPDEDDMKMSPPREKGMSPMDRLKAKRTQTTTSAKTY